MFRVAVVFQGVIVGLALLCGPIASADDSSCSDSSLGGDVKLDADDLEDITRQVLARNPLLSSSPGIKFATAQRSVRSYELAYVIYYPHSENAGIKRAFQVHCQRQAPAKAWTCEEATIRRYLRLASQDFEVRITGDLESDEVLALISATRDALKNLEKGGARSPQTAVMISPYNEGYSVTWGSPEGYQEVTMKAYLRQGGDRANAGDWQANVFVPHEL